MQFDLTSFRGRGAAERCRLALALFAGEEGVAWSDTRLGQDSEGWRALQSDLQDPRLPVLFDDAAQATVHNSFTIVRYISRVCGFEPSQTTQKNRVDGVLEDAQLFARMFHSVTASSATPAVDEYLTRSPKRRLEAAQGDETRELRVEEASAAGFFEAVEHWVESASSAATEQRLLVTERPTAADVVVYELLEAHECLREGCVVGQSSYPRCTRFFEGMRERLAATGYFAHRGQVEGGEGEAAAAAGAADAVATPSRRVCVTGAGGFIASHIVKQLLEDGRFIVHGTVRDPTNPAKVEHLRRLPGAAERLRLFQANLLEEGSFKAAMERCESVIHCASPFYIEGIENGHEEMLRPAIDGTRNVLRECLATPTVDRVVVTSSMAAVYMDERPADHFYDEDDWSDLKMLQDKRMWYPESKMRAELEAWRIAHEEVPPGRSFRLCTICPTLVMGPMLQPSVNTSCRHIHRILAGDVSEIPNGTKCLCDVRDVAQAHILAITSPSAEGRYLVVTTCLSWKAICGILRSVEDPTTGKPLQEAGYAIPSRVEEGPTPYPQAICSQERATDLGVTFTPVEKSIRETARSLIHLGLVSPGSNA